MEEEEVVFSISGQGAYSKLKYESGVHRVQRVPKTVSLEGTSIDTSAEHVKELEDELLKLRIENAFLKELRRLRLEDEAKMRERQESSAVSEDSSN